MTLQTGNNSNSIRSYDRKKKRKERFYTPNEYEAWKLWSMIKIYINAYNLMFLYLIIYFIIKKL